MATKYVDSDGVSHIGQKADARFLKQSSIAPAFSPDEAYEIGEYVMYNNTLYKFTTEKSEGAWDSSKVRTASLADDVTATDVLNVLYVDGDGYLCTREAYTTN